MRADSKMSFGIPMKKFLSRKIANGSPNAAWKRMIERKVSKIRIVTSGDILEAMTTVESGTAVNIEYPEEDTRAVAVHESGHAAASHVYMKGSESTLIWPKCRSNLWASVHSRCGKKL